MTIDDYPIIFLILIICISGCASFDKADRILIGTGLTLTMVDAYQTKRIIESDKFIETESMIDNKGDILPVMLLTDLVVIGSSSILPGKWKKGLLSFWIGLKTYAITSNYEIGVR